MRPLPRLRRLALPTVLPLLLAAALPLLGSAPASADNGVVGSVTAPAEVVLYNQCQHVQVGYALAQLPAGATQFHLHLDLFDPEGFTNQDVTAESKDSPDATAGTASFIFCGSEQAGTWTVRTSGFTLGLLPGIQNQFTLPDSTFVVRRPTTRARVTEKPLAHGKHRLTVKVKEESPDGWIPSNGAKTRVQELKNGSWQSLRGRPLTAVHGTARITLSGRKGTQVRVIVPENTNYAASISNTVRF